MKFNHLNVPTHWRNYWSRYPEGHTILEALISWVSQVDNMVDNQNNLNVNVEKFRNEIDDFVGRFDDRLQDEVTQTLNDWQTSGFLDVVISAALQWELDDYKATNEQDKLSINQQLAHKVGAGTLASMTDMGQDIKTAMTGGSVAVVGELGVENVNLGKNPLQTIGEFQRVVGKLEKGVYSTDSPNLIDNTGYWSLKTTCTPNDVYSVSVYVAATNFSIVQFYDLDGAILSQIGKGEIGLHQDYVFVVPSGAVELSISTNINQYPMPILKKYVGTNLVNKINGVEALIKNDYKPASFDLTETGKVYSRSFPNGTELAGYNTYLKNVQAGERYYVSTDVPASLDYSVAVLFTSEGYYAGDIGNVQGNQTNYEVTVPHGVSKIGVVMQTSKGTPTIATKTINHSQVSNNGNIFVSLLDNTLVIKCKYDNENDLAIKMMKRGGNGLFDFDSIYLVANENELNSDISPSTLLLNNITDWFSPYMVSAVNNDDGDLPEGYNYHFTGGNHDYTNGSTGGTPTARTGALTVLCDNVPVVGTAYGSKLAIVWTNFIQASNTKKADGSGREVLKETIRLLFDGERIHYENNIEALEDVNITRFYGLQMYNNAPSYKVKYIGGSNRPLLNAPASHNSGNKKSYAIKVVNPNLVTEFGVEPYTDLGDYAYNTETTFSAFSTTSNKSYFNIVRGVLALKAGDIATLKGYYKFYKPQ